MGYSSDRTRERDALESNAYQYVVASLVERQNSLGEQLRHVTTLKAGGCRCPPFAAVPLALGQETREMGWKAHLSGSECVEYVSQSMWLFLTCPDPKYSIRNVGLSRYPARDFFHRSSLTGLSIINIEY